MTTRQAKAAKALVEKGGSVSTALRAAGYSDAIVKNPQKVTKSQGWQEAMVMAGITPEKLFKTLQDGLKAKKTVTSLSGDVISEEPDYAIRHRYMDTGFKIAGAYSQEGTGGVHFHAHISGNREKYQL